MTSAAITPYNQALNYLAPKGTLVAVGLPPNGKFEVNIGFLVWKGIRLQGSYVG